jgi:isoleucyl-tRNA synthetase
MIKFDDVAEKMGVDTLRYYFASKNPANDIRFGYNLGYEARRRLLSFWNIYVFFITYARLDMPNFENIKRLSGKLNSSDQWLLARLYFFMTNVTSAMEDYDTPTVIREFDSFTEDVSNFYIRTNRRRFWIGNLSEDRLIGYWSLYQAIRKTVITMSPVLPFLTEAIWQEGIRPFDAQAPLSVHLADWPTLEERWQNDKILREVKDVRKVLNLALRIRKRSNLKIRQPLSTLYLVGPKYIIESSKLMAATIRNEINVKQIEYLDSEKSLQFEYLTLDFHKAGQVLRQNLSTVKALLEKLSFNQMNYVVQQVKKNKNIDLPGWKEELPYNLFLVKAQPRPNIILERKENIVVALDIKVTEPLEREGWIREILRHCQVLRKDTELNVEDRINLAITTSSIQIHKAIEKYTSFIKDETLAVDIVEHLDDSSEVREISLSVGTVQISLTKV